MRQIIGYLREYFYEINWGVFAFVTLLTTVLTFLNYYFGLDDYLSTYPNFGVSFFGRVIIFSLAFFLPYLAYYFVSRNNYFSSKEFLIPLFAAPFIFALKVAFVPTLHFSDEWATDTFWNVIFYWPALLVIIVFLLFLIWKTFHSDQPFYGVKTREIDWKPYVIMLLIMVPLVAIASTQADFLAVYPKLKLITEVSFEELSWWHKLLFELSYGTDFITIELFFRGFLILAFVKWAGKDAILPMACFYCTIHFGKPIGECISSFFGGLVLGVVVYHTRSILGGLMVHLGIAWMMEAGGYLGNYFFD
ncbi:MAG: CPBP family intramembrane metalloprotease [Chitinophagaceae bacterium]|nr:CPBP family intramembrane metalloprotease [Chitinophagaceae bacterium]